MEQFKLMKWSKRFNAYHGITSDGQDILVDEKEYNEIRDDGVRKVELTNPNIWQIYQRTNQEDEITEDPQVYRERVLREWITNL